MVRFSSARFVATTVTVALIGCSNAEGTDTELGTNDTTDGAQASEALLAQLSSVGETHALALRQSIAHTGAATATYEFPVPDGWISESDPLPPAWDPSYPWTGTEELRFLPGFPDPTSHEWWAYDYLLWIDSGPAMTTSALEEATVGYYKGLVDSCVSVPCNIDEFSARLRRIVSTPSLSVFAGEAHIFDAVAVPVTLNLVISSVVCPRSKHRALLFSASPLPVSDPLWKQLLGLQLQFRCN